MGVRLNNVAGAEADTLQSVTDRGATTTNALIIPEIKDSTDTLAIDINNAKIYAPTGFENIDYSDHYKVKIGNANATCSYSVTIGGSVTNEQNTIAMGQSSTACSLGDTAIGTSNTASGYSVGYNTILGGCSNSIESDYSSITGGYNNTICNSYCNSHIVGSGITANANDTAFVNNLRLVNDYSTIGSPVEGMLAFDYTNHVLKYYNGSTWV